jgi:hypothetical protein
LIPHCKKLWLTPLLFIVLFLAQINTTEAAFKAHPIWQFDCSTKKEAEGKEGSEIIFQILWFRDAGHATVTWDNGNGKGLREIPGFADNEQYSAHFWMSPYTSKNTGKKVAEKGHGFWLESLGPTMFSVRHTGEIAVTNHDIIYGGMKAFTQLGTCKIKSKKN